MGYPENFQTAQFENRSTDRTPKFTHLAWSGQIWKLRRFQFQLDCNPFYPKWSQSLCAWALQAVCEAWSSLTLLQSSSLLLTREMEPFSALQLYSKFDLTLFWILWSQSYIFVFKIYNFRCDLTDALDENASLHLWSGSRRLYYLEFEWYDVHAQIHCGATSRTGSISYQWIQFIS